MYPHSKIHTIKLKSNVKYFKCQNLPKPTQRREATFQRKLFKDRYQEQTERRRYLEGK